jgi:large subunit ribosomal protein L31
VKPNVHPEYNEITVHCACGNSWTTRSTAKELHLDICSNCHPFFTGRQKLIDTEGRVDRFTKKFGAQTAAARKTAAKAKKEAVAKKTTGKRKAS